MRIAIKVALCVLGLLVLVVLAVLPAHWQTRHIEPPLPTISQLRALLHRSDGPNAIHYINTAEQPTA